MIDSKSVSFADWRRLWLGLATFAALVITTVEAVLIQRKFDIFTGGFLSLNHLNGPGEIALFLSVSLIADFGITVLLVGISLWVFTKAGFNAKPVVLAVLAIAIIPVMAANYIDYQLQEYLGQAFDFALSYEIAGGSFIEILAVAAPHLIPVLLLVVGAAVLVAFAVWLFKHFLASWARLPPAPPLGRLMLRTALISSAALILTCTAWATLDSLENGLKHKQTAALFAALGEQVSDVDGDGYGLLHHPADPKPFDSSVVPFAVEIPGNGIDENGVAGDLPADFQPYTEGSEQIGRWAHRPNVLFILLESVRADLVGATHRGQYVTPVLNGLAKNGVSAPLAYSHSGYTAPSRYHILAGSLAHLRGRSTLIDDFKNNGYQVAYFSAQDASFGGRRFDVGFSRADVAFDARVEPHRRFTMFATPGSIALPYNVMVQKVTDFLEQRQDQRPLFLYVNLQDTHFPYHHRHVRNIVSDTALTRSKIAPDRAADLWSTYVNTVANVDAAVGDIVDVAKRLLRDPNPGIIVTSDSGESLYDDGKLGHGTIVNDNQTRVPLIVNNLAMEIVQPFGHVQLRDTLWRALQVESDFDRNPILRDNPNGEVFQYLGNLKRPRQIAATRLDGRNIYDFRTGLFQTTDGVWHKPDNLSEANKEIFQALVNLWERMLIATQAVEKNRSG